MHIPGSSRSIRWTSHPSLRNPSNSCRKTQVCPPTNGRCATDPAMTTLGRSMAREYSGVFGAPAVIVSGMIAATPNRGGATWAILQYLIGLRSLGCAVTFVEPVDDPGRHDRADY